MLAKKDLINSNEIATFYDVDDKRFIAIDTTSSGRIIEIRLCSSPFGEVFAKFHAKKIIYMEDVTLGSCYEALDLDSLSYYEDRFEEVVNEA